MDKKRHEELRLEALRSIGSNYDELVKMTTEIPLSVPACVLACVCYCLGEYHWQRAMDLEAEIKESESNIH